jgi:hypothetical protein
MNWDAIGAIAETLGAVGVIASLVYLAGQIRHSREQMERNTLATQGASFQQWDDSLQGTVMEGVNLLPAVDSLARLGLADFEQLGEEDSFRFAFWITSLVRRYDAAYYQYRTGMLDEDRWKMCRGDLGAWFSNTGAVQWWRSSDGVCSPEFVALVEEILAEEPDRGE